jgi:hypothetical protein
MRMLFVPIALLVVQPRSLSAQAASTYFVSVKGNDAWSGKRSTPSATGNDGPFATLEAARNAVRRRIHLEAGGTKVFIRGGLWLRTGSFVLDASDGGSAGKIVEWSSYPGEVARLAGAVRLAGWTRVRDTAVLARLPAAARDSVFVTSVPSQVELAQWKSDGQRIDPVPPEVVWNRHVLRLAHWPDTGWTRVVDVDSTHGVRLSLAGDQLSHWTRATDAWAMGYWRYDWRESYLQITGVDSASNALLMAGNPSHYGIAAGQRFRIVNLLEALSRRGEYWIDVARRLVYVWPPSDPRTAETLLSTVTEPIIDVRGASDVTLRGIDIEASRGDGVHVAGGSRVRIVGASIRAIGGRAIELRGGTRNAVDSVTIEDVGGGGVLVSGGDRRTLDPSGHIIERTRITRFARWSRTLTHAIDVAGVGVTVRGCEFSYGPHTGVMFSGNDHLIENNVLHHLLLETEDAGAVYIGRDWTSRGNIIRGNYFYSLGPSQSILARSPLAAIYLDDMASGVAVTRNVFDHAQTAVLINGGRDNVIEDNIIVHSEPVLALYPGGRGFYAERDQPNSVWQQLLELYKRARPDTAPYLIRYSSLREMIDREPGEPLGNSFTQNVVIGVGAIVSSGLPAKMLDVRGTVSISAPDTNLWSLARTQRFLDSLSSSGARSSQAMPRTMRVADPRRDSAGGVPKTSSSLRRVVARGLR